MKRLFSPWRSVYIESFQDKKKSRGCLFCRIAKEQDDKKNFILWRGENCYVVMNKYPYNSGHLMVVPYQHVSAIDKLTGKTNSEVMRTVARCTNALKKVSKPHGFNFGANLGRIAGAGIDKHVHFHLVPRWNGDTNFMPVLSDVKLVSESMDDLWSKLRQALKAK
jgi:ATP adenylyltransferase